MATTVKSSDQITIVDLTDGYSIMLSLDAISLNGGTSTLGTAQSVTVNVTAYKGGSKVVPTVTAPTCPTNVTASVGSASDSSIPVTINFAAALNQAGKVTIPVTVDDITINKEFAFGIAFRGAKGDTGENGTDAYSYDLIVSHAAINKSTSGVYNPASIKLMAKRIQGHGRLLTRLVQTNHQKLSQFLQTLLHCGVVCILQVVLQPFSISRLSPS